MPVDTGVVIPSNVDIVNMALVKLGQSTIDAFNDDDDKAIAASTLFFHNRDMLLRKLPWNFARRWSPITQLTAAPVDLDIITPSDKGTGQIHFGYAYQLPNDCLRVHRVSPKDAKWRVVGRAIYMDTSPPTMVPGPLLGVQPPGTDPNNTPVVGSSSGSQSLVGIEYIQRITDPTVFDVSFTEALINKMAMDMAFGQNGLEQIVAQAKQDFQQIMIDAAYENGVEQLPDSLFDTTIIDVRMGYGNTGIDFANG